MKVFIPELETTEGYAAGAYEVQICQFMDCSDGKKDCSKCIFDHTDKFNEFKRTLEDGDYVR